MMTINKLTIISVLFMLDLAGASAKSDDTIKLTERQCGRTNSEIKKLNQKLRAGYRVREGERLKDKLRKIKKQRYLCKKQGFAVANK
jgi:hypothetical protein